LSSCYVISLALVAGATNASQSDPGYNLYLPIVQPCNKKTSAYISASKPVVRVGEIVTLTGVIVNECSPLVGDLWFTARTAPTGVLASTVLGVEGLYSVPIGEYRELTLTMNAVSPGQVTITAQIEYESVFEDFTRPVLLDFRAVRSDRRACLTLPISRRTTTMRGRTIAAQLLQSTPLA
jgi:hypothetical protein